MAENVEYVLTLKDLISGKLDEVDKKAKGLNSTMKGLAGFAAAGFALIGGVSFLQDSAEAFNEADKASAQLNATLESTGFAAGRTKEQLDAQAESLMKVSTFDDDAITGAQSLLLTFTNIRGEILDKTTPAILDLATKMGGDLKGATIQVGKAMNDPIKGITALSRAGVSFSQSQKDVIKKMQETGDLAGAQTIILNELNKEFGGSAQADANTYGGQMTILKNEFANVKEEIGEVVMKIVVALKPAMEGTIEIIKDTVHWLKENKDIVIGVGGALVAFSLGWAAFNIVGFLSTITLSGIADSIMAVTVAMYANPIGLIIGAFVALSAGIYVAWKRSETFRGIILGVWEVLKGFASFVVTYFKSIGDILTGVFTLNPDKIKEGVKGALGAYKDLATNISSNFEKGYAQGADKVAKKSIKEKKDNIAVAPEIAGETAKKVGETSKTPKAGGVTGQKSYTINIKIDSLIKDFKISTMSMNEGANKIKDIVTQVMLSAVNDSQIIAER